MQRRPGTFQDESFGTADEMLAPEVAGGPRKVAGAYPRKGTPSWMYVAVGVAFGMMMICLVYYVHSSRAAAELAKHEAESEHIWNPHLHEDLHDMDDEQHAELMAKHGIHETDEDLRMHAKEFFEHDNNKDAFLAGPDASKAEIESMDKNHDNAVSFLEYHDGFHNEKLKNELFHHYYGEIYGKGIPNHYHSEVHPDAEKDHHITHDMDKEPHPDDEDYKEPHEKYVDHVGNQLEHEINEAHKEEQAAADAAKKKAEQKKIAANTRPRL